MNINPDNYEQWLLLYVDNELSATERSAVEEFLVQYPYLRQELEQLQQTTLPLENLFFDKKAILFKPEISVADREKMLLHLDNELSVEEKSDLEKRIADNIQLQKEWASLQKTQLNTAEIIPFPDKTLLYKKEKTRVVSITFIRWMAAAMLLGAGFWIAANFNRNNGSAQPEIVSHSTDTSIHSVKSNQGNIANTNSTETGSAESTQENELKQLTENKSEKKNEIAVTNNNVNRTTNKPVTLNKEEAAQNVQKATSNEVASVNENKKSLTQEKEEISPLNNKVLPNSNDLAALPGKKSNNSIDLSTEINTPKKEIIDIDRNANRNAYAQTASYTFDENNNSVLMMEEEDITRSKAGIFLKKLKRNIERRANIKPGKSLKIAGFELAVK